MASLFTEEEVADAKPKKKRVAKISSVGAIKDIDIPIVPGTVVVLRGANGSGKSTVQEAIRMAATAGSKTKGSLTPQDGHEGESEAAASATGTAATEPSSSRHSEM